MNETNPHDLGFALGELKATTLATHMAGGEIIRVDFSFTVTPTAGASTLTELALSLPITSDLIANTLGGSGTATYVSAAVLPVIALEDTTNDRAIVRFYAVSTNQHNIRGSFTYRIRP